MRRNEPHCTRDYPTLVPKDYPDPPKEEPEDEPQHISGVLKEVLEQFGIDVKDESMFRDLPQSEEESFRKWARDNYEANTAISLAWHPVVRDECKQINQAKGE